MPLTLLAADIRSGRFPLCPERIADALDAIHSERVAITVAPLPEPPAPKPHVAGRDGNVIAVAFVKREPAPSTGMSPTSA